MKKSLIALAVLATAGVASAQSSVTLFGIVDATIQRISNSGGASVTRLHNSGYNSSRLGFRGTEDLGGGMSASFWLEGQLTNDDGNAGGFNFQRRSTVSLAGGWGEVRLGRDYTPQFWNLTVFDPFGTNGVGTTQTLNSTVAAAGGTHVRANNSIGYFLPGKLGGFYGQIQHYRGENASNAGTPPGSTADDGNGLGIRVGYAAGPLNVALALSRTERAGALGDINQNNIGAQYDFGVAKLMGHISRDEGSTGAGAAAVRADGRGWLIGGLVPVGAGEIRLAFSQYETDPVGVGAEPKSRKIAVGYVHNLSKRTAVYTTYARVRNSNGAASAVFGGSTAGNPAANGSSSGFDLGVRHSF